MNIRQITDNKKQYLDLLLLADPQEDMIDRYLDEGEMFVLEDRGEVVACDLHENKLKRVREGAERLGLTCVTALAADGRAFRPEWEAAFDAVLADVPCSGYGIIRKKPDIRYKDPKTMENLPALQGQILANQARYVKPGGVLMYSTCTVLRRENEEVVTRFLEENRDFAPEPLILPEIFPKNETGMLTLIPGEYDTDGFFICRLRRHV